MRSATLLLVLVFASFADGIAQELPVEPGQQVRITCESLDMERMAAKLIAIHNDTLLVEYAKRRYARGRWVPDTVQSLLPKGAITRIEVVNGTRRRVGAGALVFALFFGGLFYASPPEVRGFTNSDSDRVGFAVVGVLGGATVGGSIGYLIKSDKWEEVPLDRLQVSIAPTRNGFGIGARMAF